MGQTAIKRALAAACVCALLASMLPALAEQARGLRINELMASNSGTLEDAAGASPDWLELYNPTDTAILLTAYSLSDDAKNPYAFQFPEGATLGAGEYLLVYCDGVGESVAGEWRAAFKLGAGGETVTLYQDGAAIDSATFGAQQTDVAFAREADGEWRLSWLPTPGQENKIVAEDGLPAVGGRVVINEVMASCAPFQDDPGHDWLELRNVSGEALNLAGYSLATALSGGKSYTLPDITLKAGQYVVLYCTDEPVDKGEIAAGFALSAKGATLVLRDADAEIIDVLRLPAQYGNIAYGRAGDGSLGYLDVSTPGKKNPDASYRARTDAPVLSLSGGFYAGSVTVTLSAPTGSEVRYTLDGGTPTARSTLYTEPLTFTKTTLLRAAAVAPGEILSSPVAATYFLTDAPGVPVVSMMVDKAYFDDQRTGAYAKYNEMWEYPVQIEYFDEAGESALNALCGYCIAGEGSRRFSQKGMALFARKAYGADAFAFNPFPNRDYASYQSITLRSCGTEGTKNGLRFRDALITSLAMDVNCMVSDCQPVLLYINGKLWGHYNLRERVNKHAVAQYEGVTDEDTIDDITILVGDGTVANNGSPDEYLALHAYIKAHSLNAPEALDYVLSQIDVDSYFDYAAFMIVSGSRDVTNARFYRVPGGKWKWVLYDLDTAMETVGTGIMPLQRFLRAKSARVENEFDHVPFSALMGVPAMREQFLARLGELLVQKFTKSALDAHLDAWVARMRPFIPYQCERWPLTLKAWEGSVQNVRKVLRERPAVVVEAVCKWLDVTKEEKATFFGAFLEANK